MPRDNADTAPGVIYANGAYHVRVSTARVAHQASLMMIRALMEQFAEQIHPNMLKDCRFALDANEAALKETQETPEARRLADAADLEMKATGERT